MKDKYEKAIKAIEAICRECKISFVIRFISPKIHTATVRQQWTIVVMGKNFRNDDLILAIKEAVKWVAEAEGIISKPFMDKTIEK